MDLQTRLNEALLTACSTNEVKNVICLMNVGADPFYNEGRPLISAIIGSSYQIVNLLLQNSVYSNPLAKPIIREAYRIAKESNTIVKGIQDIVEFIKDHYKHCFKEEIDIAEFNNDMIEASKLDVNSWIRIIKEAISEDQNNDGQKLKFLACYCLYDRRQTFHQLLLDAEFDICFPEIYNDITRILGKTHIGKVSKVTPNYVFTNIWQAALFRTDVITQPVYFYFKTKKELDDFMSDQKETETRFFKVSQTIAVQHDGFYYPFNACYAFPNK